MRWGERGTLCLLQYQIDEKTTVTKLPQSTANQRPMLVALGVSLSATKSKQAPPLPR